MANQDLESLFNHLIPFAQEMLSRAGEFYPFGAIVNQDHQLTTIGAGLDSKHPDCQEIILFLTQALKQMAANGEICAAGICCDIRAIPPGQTTKTDAICVRLEHQSGEVHAICLPYHKGVFGKCKYGEAFTLDCVPELFVR